MENGRILAEVVRAWVEVELPEEPGAAERAAHIAEAAYSGGASIDEACGDALGFVHSWLHHPSHWKAGHDGMVALAS